MNKISLFLPCLTALLLLSAPVDAGNIQALEKIVIERAEQDPVTAGEYFINQIETGATVEEQAVYLYGMGWAHEKLGNIAEAVNDYLSAEALGNSSASRALQRLQKSNQGWVR